MADTAHAPDVTEIRAAITARLQELKPLVDEYRRLQEADKALDALTNGNRAIPEADWARRRPAPAAPHGYKADGTPRKRPALSPDAQAKAAATRRNNRT